MNFSVVHLHWFRRRRLNYAIFETQALSSPTS
jgi:hypothetical protein